MNTSVTTYALDADWLNEQSTDTNYVHTTMTNTWWPYDYLQPWYIQPYYDPVYNTTYVTTYVDQKIKLKLSEVERLRKAARQDKRLKTVLEKFTQLIEIEVDFD